MAKAKKKPLTEEQRADNARHVAAVLMCPHRWSDPKNVRLMVEGRKKPIDGLLRVCGRCGTNRVDHDGISSMYPPQALSTDKP